MENNCHICGGITKLMRFKPTMDDDKITCMDCVRKEIDEKEYMTPIAYKAGKSTGFTEGQVAVLEYLKIFADGGEMNDIDWAIKKYAKEHKISTSFNV